MTHSLAGQAIPHFRDDLVRLRGVARDLFGREYEGLQLSAEILFEIAPR